MSEPEPIVAEVINKNGSTIHYMIMGRYAGSRKWWPGKTLYQNIYDLHRQEHHSYAETRIVKITLPN